MNRCSLLQLVNRMAEDFPDSPIFCTYVKNQLHALTFQDVRNNSAFALLTFSALPEQRIGLIGVNTPEWITTLIGLTAAGKTTALLDPLISEENLEALIERSELEALVCDSETYEDISVLMASRQKVRVLPFPDYASLPGTPLPLSGSRPEGDLLVYTSGTTRASKICVTPISSLLSHRHELCPMMHIETGSLSLFPLPLHHSFGIGSMLSAFEKQIPLVICSMKYAPRLLRRLPCEGLFAVAHLVSHLLDSGEMPPTLKHIMIGGSRCTQELADRCLDQGIEIQNDYGSSELAGGVMMTMDAGHIDELTPHPGIAAELSDDGELLITTPHHMKKYYDMPEETAQLLHGDTLHTGDAARITPAGTVILEGRKKDTLVLETGEKIYLPEVDDILAGFDGAKEAALVFASGKLTAFFSCRPEDESRLQTQLSAYNAAQPLHRRITDIRFSEIPFPRTSSGKLLRRELEMLASG